MTDPTPRIRQYFDGYERANHEFDVPQLAAAYADVFMFAGPSGVQPVRKEDFVKVLPKRKEYFKSLGLISSMIVSLEATRLDSIYALAKVVWRMRFERGRSQPVEMETSSTYILSESDNEFKIVFQIDHQDLAKVAAEVSLK